MGEGKNRRLVHSFRDAARGIWHCVKNERNFRVHLCALANVVLFGFLWRVGRDAWLAMSICFAVVLSAELFNTAVELLCDRIAEGFDQRIGLIKDISAAAVSVTAFFSAAIGAIVFLPKLFEAPRDALWLLLTAPLSLLFIFAGGKAGRRK